MDFMGDLPDWVRHEYLVSNSDGDMLWMNGVTGGLASHIIDVFQISKSWSVLE